MLQVKRVFTVFGMIALTVVVRCGDDDYDDEKDEKRRSSTDLGTYAEVSVAKTLGPLISAGALSNMH